MLNRNFKIRLDSARINAGYTQATVAKIIGVDVMTIVAWEKDSSNISMANVDKLSKLYQVPKDILFFGNKNEFIHNMRAAMA